MMQRLAMRLFLLLMSALPASSLDAVPAVSWDGDMAAEVSAGHLQLKWKPAVTLTKTELYELQQSPDAGFENARVIYRGPDEASFRSGLEPGEWYFRVRAVGEGENARGAWSEVHKVRVEYQSLGLAIGLFLLGAAVFAALVTALLKGEATEPSAGEGQA